jgi:NAD+ diphosphatase
VTELNVFEGLELDRVADSRRRDPEWIRARREDPAARAVVAGSAGVRVAGERLELVPLAEAVATAAGGPEVLLGLDAAGPVWAVDEDPPPGPAERPGMIGAGGRRGEPAPRAEGRTDLRAAGLVLERSDAGLAAYAAGLLNWHRRTRRCANCGSEVASHEGGLSLHCPVCGAQHHPRTDPVVIMLVTAADHVLLGRQPTWPEGRFSCLAGFVGPGESLEEAVVREVGEEAGVAVGRPEYVSSQPWPFPASLMIGFMAPWTEGEPGGSDDELADLRWFSRDEVEAATGPQSDDWLAGEDASRLLLPPRMAIARRLIERWLG